MSMNKNEVRARLKDLGIEFANDANKAELVAMLKEAEVQAPVADSTDEAEDVEVTIDSPEDVDVDVYEDITVEDDLVVAQRPATMVECMRQFTGKKPFAEDSE